MFKELDDNLSSMQEEINKFKNAVSHIDASKEVAEKAVQLVESTNNEFKNHLQNVIKNVDSILKPHQELIESTEKVALAIESILLPMQELFKETKALANSVQNRMDKQEEAISQVKTQALDATKELENIVQNHMSNQKKTINQIRILTLFACFLSVTGTCIILFLK